ncbi:hypothetical protein KAW18_03535 [candidate division WOR-3 bacterium]|nr:hypothetical protein [candidate division WOR-3 bacterium]
MFIPRHPVVEDQFCSYGEQTDTEAAGIGGVIAYAGTVVYLDPNAVNEEAIVKKMAYNSPAFEPFGFLMQKVKTGYHQVHPSGYYMPGDLGSSDVIAQPKYSAAGAIIGTKAAPAGVAHLGIWDTVHYTCEGTGGDVNGYGTVLTKMAPGIPLYPAADQGKVTNFTGASADDTDYDGEGCSTVEVAKVVKGASIAKCQANIDNTTLYPIRIKLLV